MNFTDPSGLWSLGPGLDIENGGIYGKGRLKIDGWPKGCPPNRDCIVPPYAVASIFIPHQRNGVFFNDIVFIQPQAYAYIDPSTGSISQHETQTHTLKVLTQSKEYTILEKLLGNPCGISDFIVPKNTDDWTLIRTYEGVSHSFHRGFFDLLTVGIALGSGFDQGYTPVNVEFGPSYENDLGVIYSLWFGQSSLERNQLDLIELWNSASFERKIFQARIGAIDSLSQAAAGTVAYSQRKYIVMIEENGGLPGLFRAIIYTRQSGRNVQTQDIITKINFLSYEQDRWEETTFRVLWTR